MASGRPREATPPSWVEGCADRVWWRRGPPLGRSWSWYIDASAESDDQPFETKTPQVVGHLRGGVRAAPQRCHLRAEVAIAKAARQMGEADEGLEERHEPRLAEAQGRDALPSDYGRLLEAVEGVLREHTVVTDVLDLEHLAIDLLA